MQRPILPFTRSSLLSSSAKLSYLILKSVTSTSSDSSTYRAIVVAPESRATFAASIVSIVPLIEQSTTRVFLSIFFGAA